MMAMGPRKRPAGPGITKIRRPSPIARRVVALLRGEDAFWHLLLDEADVVSEGAVTVEQGVALYRGTTSILLLDTRHGGHVEPEQVNTLAAVAAFDPQLRARVGRIARQEACSRAPGALDSASLEMVVMPAPQGIRIDIDVQAAVLSSARQVKLPG